MKTWRVLFLVMVVGGTCLFPGLVLAQSASSLEVPRRFDVQQVDRYVASVVKDKGLTGLALTVVKDGQIVLSKGYGLRSIAEKAVVEPETPFGIGSVTKQFACACVLLLAQDGKLSVEDKVSKYYPELTQAGEISLYQLMTHTSGYTDYYPLDFVDRRMLKPIAVDALIREYAGAKLDFAPGTRWSYSNTGYMILGRVVEKVSGEPFGSFLRRRVLEPAGMTHASTELVPSDTTRARGYLPFALGAPEPAVPEAEGWLYAAGGLWASAPDLARWDLALMNGQLLKPESWKLMTSPVTLSDGRYQDYGCGLTIRRDSGETIVAHNGAVSGFRATNILIPRTRSAVIVLINDEQPEPGIGRTIATLLLKRDPRADIPKVAGPPPSDAALGFFHAMQAGQLDRGKLGEEFSLYLTAEKVQAAAPRLKALGEPRSVEVGPPGERGGLEVSSIQLKFAGTTLRGLMYRSTDGKIQQLLFEKD